MAFNDTRFYSSQYRSINVKRCWSVVLLGLMCVQAGALEAMDDQVMQSIAGQGSILNGAPPKSSQNKSALHKSMDQTNSQEDSGSNQNNSQVQRQTSVPGVQAQQSSATLATAENMLKGLTGIGGSSTPVSGGAGNSSSSPLGDTVTSALPASALLNGAFGGSGNSSANPFSSMTYVGARGGSNVSVNINGH